MASQQPGPYRPSYIGEMADDTAGRREVLNLGQALSRPLTPHQMMSTPSQGAYYRMGIGTGELDAAGGLGGGTNNTRLWPWFVERTIDVERIQVVATTPAASTAYYSLYRNDDQLLRPDGPPWWQSAAVNLAGSTTATCQQVIEPGLWWVGYSNNNGPFVQGWVQTPLPYVAPLTQAAVSGWNFGGSVMLSSATPPTITPSTSLTQMPSGGLCPLMFAWCRQIDPPT